MSAVTFAEKIFTTTNIGRQLSERRTKFGLTTEDIVSALNISKRNLSALEENRFDDIPEGIYRDLFVKTYATYLGFSWDEMAPAYATQVSLYTAHTSLRQESAPPTAVGDRNLWVAHRILKNVSIVGGIGACALYLLFLASGIMRPPALTIASPTDHESSRSGRVQVLGSTATDANVTINGKAVPRGADGTFSQDLILTEGANTIRIVAARKYSNPHTITRTVFFTHETLGMSAPR